MSKKSTPPTDRSSSGMNDETSSEDDQKRKSSKKTTKKDSIKNYVTGLLTQHGEDDEQEIDLTQTQMKIDTNPDEFPDYENISAFRRYQSDTEGANRTDAQRQQHGSSSSDEEIKNPTPSDEVRKKILSLYL